MSAEAVVHPLAIAPVGIGGGQVGGMRQLVVLEPAGSVLVIRQHHHHHHTSSLDHNHPPPPPPPIASQRITTNNRIVLLRSSTNHTATGTASSDAKVLTSVASSSSSTENACEIETTSVVATAASEQLSSSASSNSSTSSSTKNKDVETADQNCTTAEKSTPTTNNQQTKDGDPIKLPENLETLPRAEHFPTQRHRWNTNEEIAAILISFQRHAEWQSREVKVRPRSGSMLLYSRKKVRYRRDGYCWKKRKDGKTTREDHMKLKVQGVECIYGCYVHSAILPTFHRRCYWLLQNPDVVLVHYLNVPYPDGDAKLAALPPCLALPPDKKEWTRDELASQLRPMFLGGDDSSSSSSSSSSSHPVELIVAQLLDRQQRAHGSAGHSAHHSQLAPRRVTPDNQVTSTTGTAAANNPQQQQSGGPGPPRVYSRQQQQQPPGPGGTTTTTTTTVSGAQQGQQGATAAPLVLSLQQIQGGGGLLILNSQPYHHHHHHHHQQQPQQPQQTTECEQRDVDSKDNSTHGSSAIVSDCTGGSQQQQQQQQQQSVAEFVETLDLSQEDIQRTLSANMHPSSASASPADNSIINPMDFIDTSDDVLVNLDAFDMFSDLPDPLDFEPAEHTHQHQHQKSSSHQTRIISSVDNPTAHIAEYSPEWSYVEGGVKVLVAGPWTNGCSQSYSVLFDGEPVEACLVQPGVLRCRCPAHAPGVASLQVACDGFVVSDSVAFEYRRPPQSEPSSEKALLDRLADVESRLQGPGPPSPAAHLEERLVAYCQDAVVRPWRTGAEPLQSGGPTLLHLAAGLGYSRLACALLHWRAENPSGVLDAEVDALRQDSDGLTPLGWACAAGHADTARILYRWNAMALRVRDCRNRSATELASDNGHNEIAEELNRLEARRQDERLFLRPASPSPRRASQDSGLDLTLCGSPLLDNMELLQDDDSPLGFGHHQNSGMDSAPSPDESSVGEEDARVLTLAEQIIAALPERIKRAEHMHQHGGDGGSSSSMMASPSSPLAGPALPSPLEDALMEQMPLDTGELFESYRDAASVSDVDAEASPSSPSSSCLTPDSGSPPPSSASDFSDFLQLQLQLDGSGAPSERAESSAAGAELSLSDKEQRELYQAARMIQKAYRSYKGRQRQEEAERHAAVLIQQYYRRHKQYAYHRQATKAALVIQNNYRNYRSRPGSVELAAVQQQAAHQAARKIQQFMRQSKINLSWDDSRTIAERQGSIGSIAGRRKREREAGSAGHFQGGCCPPKLALI